MNKTSIEWTDVTWNCVRGCSRVSEGCRNCYAERQAARFSGTGQAYQGLVKTVSGEPRWTGQVRLITDHLLDPLRWKEPKKIFVNSMSDLFHEGLTDQQITDIFGVMVLAHWHTFQVLTKRPERMHAYLAAGDHGIIEQFEAIQQSGGIGPRSLFKALTLRHRDGIPLAWPAPNIWLGVSVEDQKTADERIPWLLKTPAAIRFVSYEPALGAVNFKRFFFDLNIKQPAACACGHGHGFSRCPNYGSVATSCHQCKCSQFRRRSGEGIDLVIVGGESGPGARPFNLQWARDTIAQCAVAGVQCFVKQLGGNPQEIAYPTDVTPQEERRWQSDGWTKIVEGDIAHWRKYLRLEDRKGGSPAEWPAGLNVREFPAPRAAEAQQ